MQAIVFIKLRAEYAESKASSGLEVVVPMPPEVSRLSCEHASEVRPRCKHVYGTACSFALPKQQALCPAWCLIWVTSIRLVTDAIHVSVSSAAPGKVRGAGLQ